MSIALKVPEMGESVTEVDIGEWLKSPGDAVKRDEPVVVLESDKASVELPAPAGGILVRILKEPGSRAAIGETIGELDEASAGEGSAAPASREHAPVGTGRAPKGKPPPDGMPEAEARAEDAAPAPPVMSPAVRRLVEEHELDPAQLEATGKGGRLLKEDVLRHLEGTEDPGARKQEDAQAAEAATAAPRTSAERTGERPPDDGREEETVPMSALRRRIAERLVEAQRTAALLTTFNEVDLGQVMALRKSFQERFQERHGVKLGLMSFFVKATIEALKAFPALNAEIRGESIIYRNYYDIGIAVAGGKGLVVPVLRQAERMSFAAIEKAIAELAERARAARLEPSDLQGGTFSITNGGVFGSLLSTPIVNPPQSGILGMHAIQDRPVAREGRIVIRPMMYVALTYDHRIVDGREAVTFLRTIKERLEEPASLLLDL